MQTLTGEQIEPVIRQFIMDNYLYREGSDSIKGGDSFLGKGIIDSMGILELIAFVEKTFSIRVADAEMIPDNLDSIDRLTAYVQRKVVSRESSGS